MKWMIQCQHEIGTGQTRPVRKLFILNITLTRIIDQDGH